MRGSSPRMTTHALHRARDTIAAGISPSQRLHYPLRGCVARQEPYIPGALSILPGTVPGQVRGLGYMVPTYFRRELRDRVLQRPSRLRTFVSLVIGSEAKQSSRAKSWIALSQSLSSGRPRG